MVDIKLYTLLKIFECGSISEAAKQLSITQPAASQHLKALENELGVKIFDRSGGKMILTRQGNKVLNCAKKMVGLEKVLSRELADDRSRVEHLTVGVTHTAESSPIAGALAKYCSLNPGVSIKFISSPINNLYNMLRSYEIDLAVVDGRIQENDIRFVPLDTDYLALAVSPNHPLAHKEMITLSELKKERLILRLPGSATRELFAAHLESNNMSIEDCNVILELDNVATIKDLIRRDFGVSILPKSACLDELKKQKIVVLPVENLSMIREINIAYLSDFEHRDILQGIIRAYNDTIKIYI